MRCLWVRGAIQTVKHALSPWWALVTIIREANLRSSSPEDDRMVKAVPKTWASIKEGPK
jgi:hypothetical protein